MAKLVTQIPSLTQSKFFNYVTNPKLSLIIFSNRTYSASTTEV